MAATLTAVLLLGGCGGDESPSSAGTTAVAGTSSPVAPTTTAAATTPTRSAEALKAALLQPADVPGTTATPAGPDDTDLSQCFPGNPLAVEPNPGEVDGPELNANQGVVRYTYASSARVGTPEQARAFVTGLASASGSSCVLEALKARLAGPPNPVDPSAVAGKSSTVSVGDAGALMTVTGTIKAGGQEFPLALELYLFHKGGVVVFLTASALNGTLPSGGGLGLAWKVAGRLP